jgi:hypothetical protein
MTRTFRLHWLDVVHSLAVQSLSPKQPPHSLSLPAAEQILP